IVLKVFLDAASRPIGECADAGIDLAELGDGGEGHADGGGEVARQILKKLFAGAASGPLDDGPQGIEVVPSRRWRRRPFPRPWTCRVGGRRECRGTGWFLVHRGSPERVEKPATWPIRSIGGRRRSANAHVL